MQKCELYKKLNNKRVQCQVCNHYCVIENNQRGRCGVRENQNGTLYSLVYGQPCALNVDPIEKKPLFHFLPGTSTLSIATVGCNFACWNCQNWEISQSVKENATSDGFKQREVLPEKIVGLAIESKTPSISYTYTEPTIFLEYALDIMKLAKQAGLKNIWVSNGFFTKETFELIKPYLDAANIDLKSFDDSFYQKYCNGRLQPVLDNLKKLKPAGIWLEITTLIIPTLSDSPEMLAEMAKFIKSELGEEIPWHISRFSSAISWKLQHLPDTPLKTLKMAYEIGKETGLTNIHLGNI